MSIRETAISKLHELPESLLKEVNDFIDFVAHKHKSKTVPDHPETTFVETCSQWFEAVDCLTVNPSESMNDYQQLLLDKYWQQGLEL